MSRSALGDTAIMEATQAGNDGALKYTFPGGEVLRSDPIPPDKMKAGVIIQWCDTVRARDAEIIAAKEAEAVARKKGVRVSIGLDPAPPSAEDRLGPGIHPGEFVRENLEAAEDRLSKAEDVVIGARKAFEEARDARDQWKVLFDALGLEEEGGGGECGIDSDQGPVGQSEDPGSTPGRSTNDEAIDSAPA